ncbi:MAG: calcium-binding protein, partial [Thiotrichales bacterium]|nr:calcium-binding protein [Thiotrichales bacterium]
ADTIEGTHEIAVSNVADYIERFHEAYVLTKEFSKNHARDLLNERLSQLEKIAESARELLETGQEVTTDYIENIFDLFRQALNQAPPLATPLVLDLDNDGLELTSLEGSRTHFDHDANGFAEQTGWVAADDGFLVRDRNGNNRIDDGTELFGDNTPVQNGEHSAADGFAALAELDSDADQKITADDPGFQELKIWRDLNRNGRTDPGELADLSAHDITGIHLNPQAQDQTIHGHSVPMISAFERNDGSTGAVGDVFFQVNRKYTRFTGEYSLNFETLLMPMARGYGNVPDLHIAMSENEHLLNLVREFTGFDYAATQNISEKIETILYEWAGTAGIDPDSRGGMIDARKLSALEQFLGEQYNGVSGINPNSNSTPQLEEAWSTLRNAVLTRLFAQTESTPGFAQLAYSFSEDRITLHDPLADAVTTIAQGTPADTSRALSYWINYRQILTAAFAENGIDESAVNERISGAVAGTALMPFMPYLDNNPVIGTDDADVMTGMQGDDLIRGGAGNDMITETHGGNNVLDGGPGDDVLRADSYNSHYMNLFHGGTGNDVLDGGIYADTYLFNRGDGQDLIIEPYTLDSSEDRIIMGPGIHAEDIQASRSGNDLIMQVGSDGDQITVRNWYATNSPGVSFRIEGMYFEDGSHMSGEELHAMGLAINGTGQDDLLRGTSSDDTIFGHAGNDTIKGYSGNDKLHGDSGNDVIYAGSGNDIIYGGDGDDWIDGQGNHDVIYGGAGNDRLKSGWGNDQLYGGAGDDRLWSKNYSPGYTVQLHGGSGNDLLFGQTQGDHYFFNRGDGQDRIYEVYADNQKEDRLYLGPGIQEDEVFVTRA